MSRKWDDLLRLGIAAKSKVFGPSKKLVILIIKISNFHHFFLYNFVLWKKNMIFLTYNCPKSRQITMYDKMWHKNRCPSNFENFVIFLIQTKTNLWKKSSKNAGISSEVGLLRAELGSEDISKKQRNHRKSDEKK